IADDTWAAKQGLAQLVVRWDEGEHARVDSAAIARDMEAASRRAGSVAEKKGAVDAAAARTIEATYQLPFLAHATMEPVSCTVHVQDGACDVWVGTQVPVMAREAAARAAGLKSGAVRIHNHLLGGGFGRRLEVDFIERAVRIARQ